MNKSAIELKHLVRTPLDSTPSAPLLVLLHGYGSNEVDLFSLARHVPANWFVVSVRGPFAISDTEFKWYDGRLERGEIVIDLVTEEQSRMALLRFVHEFVQENDVDPSKVVVAGFSQGAGLGLTLALTEPEKIHAAACFSGRVMEQVKPLIKSSEALKSKRVFIGHGTEDPMSPLKNIEANKRWLEEFGIDVNMKTYRMGHTIVSQEVTDFVSWLEEVSQTE